MILFELLNFIGYVVYKFVFRKKVKLQWGLLLEPKFVLVGLFVVIGIVYFFTSFLI